ncbi:helix-turn-helix domain-containing protein [Brevundimonas sp.]
MDQYLSRKRGSQSALAKRLGLAAGTLSSIRSGQRRPSTALAKRIEAATDGEVSAAALLGLAETASAFDHQLAAHSLGDGRWAVNVGADGSAVLTPEMTSALGFGPGEQLLFVKVGGSVVVTSGADAIVRARATFSRRVPVNTDVVGDFLADRRAEAARE